MKKKTPVIVDVSAAQSLHCWSFASDFSDAGEDGGLGQWEKFEIEPPGQDFTTCFVRLLCWEVGYEIRRKSSLPKNVSWQVVITESPWLHCIELAIERKIF